MGNFSISDVKIMDSTKRDLKISASTTKIQKKLHFSVNSFSGCCGLAIFFHPLITGWNRTSPRFIKPELRYLMYKYIFLNMLNRLSTSYIKGFVVSDNYRKSGVKEYINIQELMEYFSEYFNISSIGSTSINGETNRIITGSFMCPNRMELSSIIKKIRNHKIEGIDNEDEIIREFKNVYNLEIKEYTEGE